MFGETSVQLNFKGFFAKESEVLSRKFELIDFPHFRGRNLHGVVEMERQLEYKLITCTPAFKANETLN